MISLHFSFCGVERSFRFRDHNHHNQKAIKQQKANDGKSKSKLKISPLVPKEFKSSLR